MRELTNVPRIPNPNPHPSAHVRKEDSPRPGFSLAKDPRFLLPQDPGNRPTTVYVGGQSRSVVNAVAFAFAEMLDLTPFWLDVRDGSTPAAGPDPVSIGWIPPERLFVSVSGHGLEPESPGVDRALWSIIRPDEPASVLSRLTDFLRLPELIQEIVSAAAPGGGPKALVAANSDRVAHLFPKTPDGLQKFLFTLTASSLSIVAAHTGPLSPGRFGFETVFQVNVASAAEWQEGTLVCEKGILQGPFAVGRSNRLSDVPSIANVLTGLLGKARQAR